jgi:3'(2'), 5'-bisphosphate nucleotidase
LKEYLENPGEYELVPMGSSIKICLAAEGSAHVYSRSGPTSEWDKL